MPLLLGQSENITSWLTPVWILSTGIGAGFLLVLLVWAILLVLGKWPLVNRLNDQPGSRLAAGFVLSVVIFGLLYWYSSSRGYWSLRVGDIEEDRFSHLLMMAIWYVGGSLLAGFGLVAAVSRKRRDEIRYCVHDGFVWWTSIICIAAAIFSVAGYVLAKGGGFGFLVPVDNPDALLVSAAQLPVFGESRTTFTAPSENPPGGYPVAVRALDGRYLRWMLVKTTQDIDIASRPIDENMANVDLFDVDSIQSGDKGVLYIKGENDSRFPNEPIPTLYVSNRGNGPAEVSISWLTTAEYPQAFLFYWAAGSVVLLFTGYLLFAAAFPRVYAIAHATFKTEISQPVFLILLLIGLVFIVGSIYIPYNTFGEDIKMYKDSGLTLLRVLGIFLAVWAASKSLAEEIEGRTALTVLSKPVSRRQFILGKYAGIGLSIALLFIALGIWFIIWTSYKPIYDSRESTVRDFTWQNCFREGMSTVPGLVLAWLEAMVFAAISVVISTRLGILANFLICFSIYVLGHLTPLMVQSAAVAQSFEGVVVFGQIVSIVVPVLDHFDINAAITGDVQVPVAYLGWATLYCGLYGLIALLLALVLFEDRDLA